MSMETTTTTIFFGSVVVRTNSSCRVFFIYIHFEAIFFVSEWWKRNERKRPKKRNCFILTLCLHLKRLTQNIHSHNTHKTHHTHRDHISREREKRNDISNKKNMCIQKRTHTHTRRKQTGEIRSSSSNTTVITFIQWKNLRFRGDTQWFFVLFSTTAATMKTISSSSTTTRTLLNKRTLFTLIYLDGKQRKREGIFSLFLI